ncbi:MAG: HIT domain-containing protein [Patescibacteria group bacterium]
MTDIFCSIISGEIPADVVFRDEAVIVFKDIRPQAPVHLLVVPIRHMEGIGDADTATLGTLLMAAHRVAHEQGLVDGYRLIVNDGEHGGKIVPHLHIHVLGGKHLGPKLAQDSEVV